MLKFGKAALYERIIQEKVRQIDILAEQIEYLRAQLASRGTFVPGAAVNPTEQPELGVPLSPQLWETKNHVSDEELDIQALVDSRPELQEAEIREIVEGLGLSPEFELDNIRFD